MRQIHPDHLRYFSYGLLLTGFLLLIVNHLTITLGHPWLIPHFLRLY